MDKGTLLDRLGTAGEDRLLLARILDRARQAQSRNIPVSTDFLSPQQQMLAKDLMRFAGICETAYVWLGGYEGAERKVLLFLPDWLEPDMAESPIRLLRAAFRPEDKLNHRDFLGSLMGMGIVREKIGDILVGEGSADILVLDTIEEFLLQSWTGAGRARITVTSLDPAFIHIPQLKYELLKDTVSSLRLDSVVSTGFRMARGKAAELIASGRVQVNWRECTKPDKLLNAGDTVSARGFGKFELTEVGGLTKKGRTSITVKRYI